MVFVGVRLPEAHAQIHTVKGITVSNTVQFTVETCEHFAGFDRRVVRQDGIDRVWSVIHQPVFGESGTRWIADRFEVCRFDDADGGEVIVDWASEDEVWAAIREDIALHTVKGA